VSVIPGKPYAARLEGVSARGPLNWSLSGGSLPTGLALSADGHMTGITSQDGVFHFTVTASDGAAEASADVSLRVLRLLPNSVVGLELAVGEWVPHPDLGWIYGVAPSIGYVLHMGFVDTRHAPWFHHAAWGWFTPQPVTAGESPARALYSPDSGWWLRSSGSTFNYLSNGEWVSADFLGAP
jgi:hypothetical protein